MPKADDARVLLAWPGTVLDLAHLHVVVQVAQTGSATQAAAQLFRAQSAITRSVGQIETALEAKLFERLPSGMLPTTLGAAVVARAARVFDELGALARWIETQRPATHARAAGTIPAYLLNTRRLTLLVALARSRHMPTTAVSLGISQPAVSSAVRVLEAGAGFKFFTRGNRGLQLTEAGRACVLSIRRALNELRHIPDDIAALAGDVRGLVRVGSLPLGRTLILPEAIARVARAYPGIRVVTDESPYETLVAGLEAGDVDFILGALRAVDPASDLRIEPLMAESMVVLARRGHPLASVKKLKLAALAQAQWLLARQHSPGRAIFDELFRRLNLPQPQYTVESADLATMRGVLLRTDMIAALSEQQARYEQEMGHLIILPVALPGTERAIGLTARAVAQPSPAASRLMEAVRQAVVDIVS